MLVRYQICKKGINHVYKHKVQVYPDGIRHIRADRRVNEWKAPGRRTIVRCALNKRQVAIALSGGEIVYFELDMVHRMLQ